MDNPCGQRRRFRDSASSRCRSRLRLETCATARCGLLSCTPMMPTIRSRSSTVANSIVILPLRRPMSTLTRVSNRSDSRSARSVSAGACGLARRCGAAFFAGPPSATASDTISSVARTDSPSATIRWRERLLLPRRPRARAAPAHARPTARRPRPAAAPAPAGSAAGSCWRSAAGSGRSAGRAPRASRRTPRAAADRRPPLPAGSGSPGGCSPAARRAASRRRGSPGRSPGWSSWPSAWAARHRRSPMTSSYCPSPSSRTTIGWRKPTSWIEVFSSSSASSSKTCRGCFGFGTIESTGISANRAPGHRSELLVVRRRRGRAVASGAARVVGTGRSRRRRRRCRPSPLAPARRRGDQRAEPAAQTAPRRFFMPRLPPARPAHRAVAISCAASK